MIEKNFILILLFASLLSVSFIIAFKFNFIESFIYSLLVLLLPFLVVFLISSRQGIYLELNAWNYGLIISILFSLLKFPVFPFIYFNVYYKKFERVLKRMVTEQEVSYYVFFFVFLIFILNFFGIIFLNFKFSIIASSLLFSMLLPYRNSPGNMLILINPLVYGFIITFSFISYLLSFYIIFFL